MRNTTIYFCHILDATPYLASFGNEVVIGIDDQKCSGVLLLLIGHVCHALARRPSCPLDCVQGMVRALTEWCVTGIDEVVSLGRLVASETSFVLRLVGRFAVRKVPEPPAGCRVMLFRILDHDLHITVDLATKA